MKSGFQTSARCAGFILLVSALLVGCDSGTGSAPNPITVEPPPTPWGLRATTDTGLTAYFRDALGPSSTNYLHTPIPTVGFSAAPPTAFSGTTLQEAGVDEADLVKSDGVYVFSLDQASSTKPMRETLSRQRLDGAAANAPLIFTDSLKIPFSTNVSGSGLYLDTERQQIVAVGKRMNEWEIYATWFAPLSWENSLTEVALIDTSSPTQLQTRSTLSMTGELIGSRRLGATLYLVLRSYPQVAGLDPLWPPEKTAANQKVVDSLQASQLLPTLSVDGGAAQPLVQASSCLTQEQNPIRSADIITIVGIDLASPTHQYSARCFTGGTEAFYMSDQSLYLATTRNAYTYSGEFPVYPAETTTDIHKFALNGLDIAYRGSGNVLGHLGFDQNRKSFRMGEYAGALRVVTQTTQTQLVWGEWILPPASPASATTSTAIDSPGHLSILQESAGALQLVGELPNTARPQPLGKPGEQLYASRFIGARGYLVTYRLTDPLYVLDLSNPADPKMAGELQVDGYSDYLFPLNESLLLGIGKDATSDGSSGDGRFAWYQGVKVSLIDVSDPAHPQETARQIIGRRGTDATVLHDHHGIALQYLGDAVHVSLPVSLYDTPMQWGMSAPSNYYDFTRTELQRFEVNLAARSLMPRQAVASTVPGARDIANDRSLLWNNQAHWYQDGTWISAGW
ncbi:MAG: beta-propeller domain-containing protein [Gallionella sp.]|nr:beta-propeller domain-containing protein [Gallionella sp.]